MKAKPSPKPSPEKKRKRGRAEEAEEAPRSLKARAELLPTSSGLCRRSPNQAASPRPPAPSMD